MKSISLLLDDIAFIRSGLNDDQFDPVRFGIQAETAGVNGLACTYAGSPKGISERDLKLLNEVKQTFFNMRIPVNSESTRLALSIMPDMVTFVDVKSSDPRKVIPLNPNQIQSEIEHIVPDLQANNISVSILITPDIDTLKAISKLPIDYVEIDVSEYTSAADVNEEIVALDKIKSASMAVGKWGMGINCIGNIGYYHIPALAHIPNLEDIILGTKFMQRALLVGLDRAVTEAIQLMRFREID
jgi:pyridoxine 5-phosphate synthase